jgi:hypothetical protein
MKLIETVATGQIGLPFGWATDLESGLEQQKLKTAIPRWDGQVRSPWIGHRRK